MTLDCIKLGSAAVEQVAQDPPLSEQPKQPVEGIATAKKTGGVDSVNLNQAAKDLFKTYPAPAPLLVSSQSCKA
jgi:hypothetical protein